MRWLIAWLGAVLFLGLPAFAQSPDETTVETKRVVVFVGDSLTEGWPRGGPDAFPSERVFLGVRGETSGQMRRRFAREVMQLKPAVVHIMAGTNDIAGNGGTARLSETRKNIAAMAKLAKAQGAAVVLASVPPVDAFPWAPRVTPGPRIQTLNAMLRAEADLNGLVYADYHAVLAEPEGGVRPGFTYDGVHLTYEAYMAMEPIAREAIAAALAR